MLRALPLHDRGRKFETISRAARKHVITPAPPAASHSVKTPSRWTRPPQADAGVPVLRRLAPDRLVRQQEVQDVVLFKVPKRAPAHYLWVIARIYEVFPLLCPKCGGQMRLIALITEGVQIRRILDHIGADSEPPRISPARAPPLWDECGDAQSDDGAKIEPDWDLAAQPAPGYEVDQRISW